jgi:hypothetical protein
MRGKVCLFRRGDGMPRPAILFPAPVSLFNRPHLRPNGYHPFFSAGASPTSGNRMALVLH